MKPDSTLHNEEFFAEIITEGETVADAKASWYPTTLSDCESLLERLFYDDAEIAALKIQEQSIRANIKEAITRIERRRAAYEYLYSPAIIKILDEAGKKDHLTAFGKLKRYISKGSVNVADHEFAAQALYDEGETECVEKILKVKVSLLTPEFREELMKMKPEDALDKLGLEIDPPREKVGLYTIRAGANEV